MAVKKCCIQKCKSSSTRKEDHGVTFHKFPKDVTSREKWQSAIRFGHLNKELPAYVCSRHFCKGDFQKNKDSKYILKSDAIPSIFPWDHVKMDTSQIHDALSSNVAEQEKNVSFESTGSDAENLEAIKKFIEEQEKEIQESKDDGKKSTKSTENADTKDKEGPDESFEVATKVMDMILTESEAKIDKQQVENASKQDLSPIAKGDHKIIRSNDKGNGSMSLYIGSKVEAKDFEEDWYAAEIVEVDYEDMEVLVRYEPEWKKLDEWINVSSPRLRPYTGNTVKPGDKESEVKEAKDSTNEKNPASQIVEEPIKELDEPKEELKPELVKTEDKPKIVFEVGERCLARWRDNRRFVATVHKDLGDGKFEVIFDDGVHWTCSVTRMHKMKADKNDALHIDTTFQASVGSPSPLETPGTSHLPISPSIPPAFHTHLFDPTRDYLGSKSERREKKRKLNIKEIFNIDQRKNKIPKKEKPKTPVEKKPRAPKKDIAKVPKLELKKMTKVELLKKEIKTEVPDAVASIIGSIKKEEPVSEIKSELDIGTPECSEKESIAEDLNENIEKLTAEVGKINEEIQEYKHAIDIMEPEGVVVDPNDKTLDDEDTEEPKSEGDPVLEEEVTLENFEKKDVQEHEEAIDKIKEAIIKLEDGLNDIENQGSPKVIRAGTPKTESELPPGNSKEMMTLEDLQSLPESVDITVVDTNIDNLDLDESPSEESRVTQTPEKISKSKKDPTRIKKSKKLRLMHEKKVKRDVERVKNELARMKRKFEEMRREMLEKQWELAKSREMPERVSEEWCCKWVNGQPVGKVSEIEAPPSLGSDDPPALPRRSVQVQDKRLPPGWSKHMVRRSTGHSAGKWHVVLASPKECGNKKFYTKADMRVFLENFPDESLKPYEHALMDFGVHLKLSRQLGWIVNTPDGIAEGPDTILPAGSSSLSPQASRNKMKLKKRSLMMKDKRLVKRDKKRRPIKLKLQRGLHTYNSQIVGGESSSEIQMEPVDTMLEQMPLEDGYVYVGSLKVQIIENLLRCPAEGCFKNFRTKTLLQMHIKHYHRELKAMMGATPKVLDLAYARTMPNDIESPPPEKKIIKVKIQKPVKRTEEPKPQIVDPPEIPIDTFPIKAEETLPKIPRSQDSPKLRHALINSNKPVKRPRVLLPVRRPEPEPSDSNDDFDNTEPAVDIPALDQALDFETAISTHTVTKPAEKRKKVDKKKSFASMSKNISEDEEMFAMVSDDFDTRSSFPRSGSPDSKMDMKTAPVSSESNDDLKDNNQMYTYNDAGERVKIVHMKREEIINCHCGIREEDGLMVQCELCLCWQHALCHNIQRESEVPEKYTCSICLNPRRGRRSRRFVHDQDRLYEGALVGGRAREPLRRAHELAGNLLRAQDALHALRLKGYVASKKSHPKLYLWAKDWEQAETSYSPDKLNSEYSAMHAMINGIGKENLPMRSDDDVDISTPPSEEQDQVGMSRDSQLGPHSLLSGLLSSDLLNTPEFNSLADSVQESSDWQRTAAPVPVPEAAIENDACRERLLRHIERCHALIDARLESIEAQVAELESREPSFGEHYETADYYPQTKQTIQMLMRDLDNMEELGVIT